MKSLLHVKGLVTAILSLALNLQLSGGIHVYAYGTVNVTNGSEWPLQYSVTEFKFGSTTTSWTLIGYRVGEIVTYYTDGSVDYQPIYQILTGSGMDSVHYNELKVSVETVQPGETLIRDDYVYEESSESEQLHEDSYYDFTSNGEADIVTSWTDVYNYAITVSDNINYVYSIN